MTSSFGERLQEAGGSCGGQGGGEPRGRRAEGTGTGRAAGRPDARPLLARLMALLPLTPEVIFLQPHCSSEETQEDDPSDCWLSSTAQEVPGPPRAAGTQQSD